MNETVKHMFSDLNMLLNICPDVKELVKHPLPTVSFSSFCFLRHLIDWIAFKLLAAPEAFTFLYPPSHRTTNQHGELNRVGELLHVTEGTDLMMS